MSVSDGRGLCHDVAPDLIELDEWGYPLLPGGSLRAPITRAHRKAAEDAKDEIEELLTLAGFKTVRRVAVTDLVLAAADEVVKLHKQFAHVRWRIQGIGMGCANGDMQDGSTRGAKMVSQAQ